MKLLSPSLWLASGNVVTGFHTDGPDNLLVQLEGSKEVLMADPSETENLHYSSVADVAADMRLEEDGTVVRQGLHIGDRSSAGHSVIDLTNPQQVKHFPSFEDVRGTICKIEEGDVLYIPSFWHHAVVTSPNEECHGLSLNLWYTSPYARGSSEQVKEMWRKRRANMDKKKKEKQEAAAKGQEL